MPDQLGVPFGVENDAPGGAPVFRPGLKPQRDGSILSAAHPKGQRAHGALHPLNRGDLGRIELLNRGAGLHIKGDLAARDIGKAQCFDLRDQIVCIGILEERQGDRSFRCLPVQRAPRLETEASCVPNH